MVDDGFNKIEVNQEAESAPVRPAVEAPVETIVEAKAEPAKKTKSRRRMPKWLKIVLIVLLVLFLLTGGQLLIFSPGLLAAGRGVYQSAQAAAAAAQNQDLVTAEQELEQVEVKLERLQKRYRLLISFRFIPGISAYYQDGAAAIEAAQASVKAGQTLFQAITPYADVLGLKGKGTFAGGTTEDRIAMIIETISKVTPQIDEVIDSLDQAAGTVERINPQRYPESVFGQPVRPQVVQAKDLLTNAAATLKQVKPGLDILPALLGHPDKRQYLVLFQNDTERRPTGGFMTAYTILEVDAGKIKTGKSEDIYTLDAKFKERLAPPEAIKNYHKNVSYFYLRDMNISPDFKTSMDLFRKYYDDLPGESEVDGVIAVNTRVLLRLVDLFGPIEVPGFGKFTSETDERCNCPNVIYELELVADEPTQFVKESRKGVLGPLMQQIMASAMGADKALWPQLFADLWTSLKQKDLLLYFDDSTEQTAAEAMDFAGRIQAIDKGDYFFLVDTNFAGAKSDLYIEEAVTQEIQVANDGSVEKTVTIEYRNPEEADNCNLERKSGLCLNGLYRDWVRIYAPQGSELIEVLGSEVEEISYDEAGKTVFEAFYGDESPLRPLGKSKLVFRYRLPFTVDKNYSLYIQKQAGNKPFEYQVNVNGEIQTFNLDQDKDLNFKL